MILFALPAMAAWFYYLNPEMLPQGRSNNGQLIVPVISVTEISLATAQGTSLDLSSLRPNWTLLILGSGNCDAACRGRTAEARQIQKALAENGSRLERLLVLQGEQVMPSVLALNGSVPGTHITLASDQLLQVLSATQEHGVESVNNVFIIDPRGNLMMQYHPDTSAKEILEDLERLMKASKSWVKGAQYGHR